MSNRREGWSKGIAAMVTAIVGLHPSGIHAQNVDRGLIVSVMAGPSVVGSRNRFVGVERGIHLGLSVGRAVSAGVAVSLRFDAYAGSTMESTPECVPGATYCGSRTELPGAMLGFSLESRLRSWRGRVGLALGAGIVNAPDAKGPVSKSSGTVAAGIDYEFGESGLLPVIGVRFTQMFSDVAGVRWIVSPALGVRF